MPLHHKPTAADVRASFERFARLAPGTNATLDADAGEPTYYRITGSRTPLDGITYAGHARMLATIEAYIEARTEGART
jgi:hypothetical protein